jgi:DNA-binding beta-propeller fold protein YncE
MTQNLIWLSKLATFALLTAICLPGQSSDPITLPTGFAITPKAAPHSVLQLLNPGLPALPNYVAGQAVSTALSPDGTQLLVLTSGFNAVADKQGKAQTNEYIFVFSTTSNPPQQTQVLTVPNSFCGLAWNPSGQEFYVSGGVDDKLYVFTRSGTVAAFNNAPPIRRLRLSLWATRSETAFCLTHPRRSMHWRRSR